MLTNEYILGIDLGGTNMRLGFVDYEHKLVDSKLVKTQEAFADTSNPTDKLSEIIKIYCDEKLGEGILPKAVSIGFPSTVSKDKKVVIQTPNIACIPDNYHIVDELQARLNIPVFVNRDVNLLVLYDLENMNLNPKNAVALYFGTGIGNTAIIDGKFLTGQNGVALEVGHIPVIGTNKKCSCGNSGCLETVCSGLVLEELKNTVFKDTHISELFVKHKESNELKQFVDNMGQIVALEINLFDPEMVILGGGLLQMKDFPIKDLEISVRNHTRKPYPGDAVSIKYSNPNQDNGIIGASIYAFKRLEDEDYI